VRALSTSSVRRVSTPRLRPVLGSLGAYRPGRRPAPGQDYSRLASNETPFPLLPPVQQAIAEAVADGNRYPDPGVTRLTELLARKHAVDADRLAVGCGSVQLVQELVEIACDADDEVVYGWRSFEAYPTLTAIAGARSVQVPLKDAHLDLDAMAASVTGRTRLVVLCSPNNPTGPALGQDEVKSFLEAVPRDVTVVLDEAYAEFVDDPLAVDGTRLLSTYPNLVVLRTFSKAFGLAGLRVGYAIAGDPAVAAAIRQVHLPFAVSVPAQAAAIASLEVEEQLMAQVAQVVERREPLRQRLIEIGWDIPPSQGNFVWLPTGADTDRVSEVFEEHAVLVRAFSGEGIRVTVGLDKDNDRVVAAARAAR
jgi:histidinol-phosphate aminotransferase